MKSHLIPLWQDIEVLGAISKALTPVAVLTNLLSGGKYANPAKTWLILKEEHLHSAKMTFASTGVNITTHGKHL